MINYKEIKEKTDEYFNNNYLLSDVFINKYALFDSKTKTFTEQSPYDMFIRIAKELHRIEQKYPNPIPYDKIYELVTDFKYIIPGGSNLYGIGNNKSYSTLGNCYVIGTEDDSYSGIFRNDEQLAQLMKRRAGVGLDISFLRPNGAVATNSAKYSTGAVSFAQRFSNTTREVAQDGRRGALMLSIDVKHPDANSFISMKDDLTKVTGANISLKIDDVFMNAVINNDIYLQTFPIDKKEEISYYTNTTINNTYEINTLYKWDVDNNVYFKFINAKELWDSLIYHAWKNAEPGILFWDKIIKESPADIYEGFKTVSTNPCVVGDTLILTNLGFIKIKNLNSYQKNDVKIITQDKYGKLYNSDLKWVGITKTDDEIYKVNLDNNEYFLVNDKHKFYDVNFEEINILETENQLVLGFNKAIKVLTVEKTKLKEDVYDLTAIPNYNFFSILNRKEHIIKDDIIINDTIKFKYFEIVETTIGQMFAFQLTKEHELK